MDCNKAQLLLGAWQDGELSALTAGRVRRHLRHCPQCTAETNELQRLAETLRDAAPFGPEPSRSRPLAPPLLTFRRIAAPLLAVGCCALAWAAYHVPLRGRPASPSPRAVSVAPPPRLRVAPPSVTPIEAVMPSNQRTTESSVASVPKETPRRVVRRHRVGTPGRRHRITQRESVRRVVASAKKASPAAPPRLEQREEILVVAAREWTPEEIRQRGRAAREAARRFYPPAKEEETL